MDDIYSKIWIGISEHIGTGLYVLVLMSPNNFYRGFGVNVLCMSVTHFISFNEVTDDLL